MSPGEADTGPGEADNGAGGVRSLAGKLRDVRAGLSSEFIVRWFVLCFSESSRLLEAHNKLAWTVPVVR